MATETPKKKPRPWKNLRRIRELVGHELNQEGVQQNVRQFPHLKMLREMMGRPQQNSTLPLTQRLFANDLQIEFQTYKALEIGNRSTPKIREKWSPIIAERTGANLRQLLQDDPGPLLNSKGGRYSIYDYAGALVASRKRTNTDLARVKRAEFAQAFYLLILFDEAWKQVDNEFRELWDKLSRLPNFDPSRHLPRRFRGKGYLPGQGRSEFHARLNDFFRSEENALPALHLELQELREAWTKENPERAQNIVSWLYPRDPGIFDLLKSELEECRRTFKLHGLSVKRGKA